MAYTKTTWVNDSQPAISAENLNNIENGISALDTAVGSTDISSVGDGTVTGAISTLNSSISTLNSSLQYALRYTLTTLSDSTITANQLGLSTIVGAVGCGLIDGYTIHTQVKSLTPNSFVQMTRYWNGTSWEPSGASVMWLVWGTL